MGAALHPPEFRRRARELARQPDASAATVARDLGISEAGLRRWLPRRTSTPAARRVPPAEREELPQRVRRRRLASEIEILKRASSACFTRGNVPPKGGSGKSNSFPPTVSPSP